MAVDLGLLMLGPLVASAQLGLLPLDVVLCQVAVLALSVGVVWLVLVDAVGCQLGLALSVVAVMAHVLRVVLFGAVRAHEDV